MLQPIENLPDGSLVFERCDGLSSGGAREDLKMGLEHLRKGRRIALVTDLD